MTSLLTVDESVDQHDLTELLDAVASVRAAVARLVDERLPVTACEVSQGRTVDGALSSLPSESHSRLARVVSRFGLDQFEAGLLLLCAGAEVDPELAGLLSRAAGPGRSVLPTFQLAMAVLPGGHWRAIGPGSPLRRWRMIEVGPGDSLVASPLRISERLLMHLIGVDQLDERLAGVVRPGAHGVPLDAAYHRASERLASAWAGEPGPRGLTDGPVVLLVGGDIDVHPAIVANACTLLGLTRCDLNEAALPSQAHELDALSRLWEREALLCDAALLVNIDDVGRDTARDGILRRFLQDTGGCIAVSGERVVKLQGRDVVTITVPRVGSEERRAAWEAGLAEAGLPAGCTAHEAAVREFLARYRFSSLEVRAACRQAARTLRVPEQSGTDAEVVAAVHEACAGRVHPRMDGLADRIDTTAGWDDLVLPEPQTQMLRGIVRRVRHRNRVLTQWGFGGFRGTAGVNALFAGPSGTGKTMAAGVVAGELGVDLYRVDLSGVVDKYIGETEKNLSRIFAAAQRSGAVLFFDEADALFGRRSEVRDSHDRYANIQVSHLLQRMDSYDGLAILATNLSTAMDSAFLRRLTYVVRFPFPDVEQRRRMWRNAFPAQTPTIGLDDEKLAALLVSGGSIRNIALAAAFRAADADVPVGMGHLLSCAVEECAKHERPVLPAEVQGWV